MVGTHRQCARGRLKAVLRSRGASTPLQSGARNKRSSHSHNLIRKITETDEQAGREQSKRLPPKIPRAPVIATPARNGNLEIVPGLIHRRAERGISLRFGSALAEIAHPWPNGP